MAKMHSQELVPLLYAGSPLLQLKRAKQLADWLVRHPAEAAPLLAGLPLLHQAAAELNRQMEALQLGHTCAACAAKSYGGCCSAYMAANADTPLMVLNILLGVELEMQDHAEDACCFLGATGCLFIAKPIFCLNYYCSHLRESIAMDDMRNLEKLAAKVLGLQSVWEEQLLAFLRSSQIPFSS